MADAWYIKEGDTDANYIATLKSSYGLPGEAPINLTAAASVRFIMRSSGLSGSDPAKVNAVMTITDAVNGIVTYPWAVGDTDTPDTYNVEFEIHWAGGGVETVPNDSYLTIIVVNDLG